MIELPNDAADDDNDMNDGMRCSFHPYRSNQGGICALCLQDKLGKLFSSTSPLPLRASSSSSSSSSFRSDFATAVSGNGGGFSAASSANFVPENGCDCKDHRAARIRIPFLSKKKKQPEVGFRRSKSTTAPTRGKFMDSYDGEVHSHKNRGWIWSLFDFSTKSHSSRKTDHSLRDSSKFESLPTAATSVKQKEKCAESIKDFSGAGTAEDDGGGEDSPNSSHATASISSFERKVSRSRSVGCGSRSFSGDLFERITGFGDCTLRRVESHREGKLKITSTAIAAVHDGGDSSECLRDREGKLKITSTTIAALHDGGDRSECLRERVKCGEIFGGFMIQTFSSSSSASSTYWVSSSSGKGGRFPSYGQGRSKNRGWAFASPRRASAEPPPSLSSEGKRESSEKNSTPNLDAIPSLLAVRI